MASALHRTKPNVLSLTSVRIGRRSARSRSSSGLFGSFLQFQNRFNWIGQQQDDETNPETYLLCKNEVEQGISCSHIYRKDHFDGDTCPVCNKYAAVDIYKAQQLNLSINDNKLHKIFFARVPEIFESLNISVWESLEDTAWRTANDKEMAYLLFCLAFVKSSAHVAETEGQYWEDTLNIEAEIRRELIDNRRFVAKKMEFDLGWLADGLDTRREVRTLQANYGVAIVGPILNTLPRAECEAKYQRAIKITERIVTLGCSSKDDLPYFAA